MLHLTVGMGRFRSGHFLGIFVVLSIECMIFSVDSCHDAKIPSIDFLKKELDLGSM